MHSESAAAPSGVSVSAVSSWVADTVSRSTWAAAAARGRGECSDMILRYLEISIINKDMSYIYRYLYIFGYL